jgi:hypothetical protein
MQGNRLRRWLRLVSPNLSSSMMPFASSLSSRVEVGVLSFHMVAQAPLVGRRQAGQFVQRRTPVPVRSVAKLQLAHEFNLRKGRFF